MATARTSYPSVLYNGTDMAVYMQSYLTAFSYTDNASSETDCIDISIQDADMKWMNSWMPKKGDTLQASLIVRNWKNDRDNRTLKCGKFTLDDFRFAGPPTTGTISAVATPASTSFRETKITKTWLKVTLKEIASSVASAAGVSLDWRVEAADFTLETVEQDEQTNCEFLAEICKKYGYYIKLYNDKIVIFSRLEVKKKPAKKAISKTQISSWSWQTTLAGTYTGGRLTYTDPDTEKTTLSLYKAPKEKLSNGDDERLLDINTKSESEADAERIITAAVEDANHSGTTLSINMMGDPGYVAGTCVNVYGLGKLSGKYYIDQAKHNMSGSGYVMQMKLSLVDLTGTDGTMKTTVSGEVEEATRNAKLSLMEKQ